MATAAAVAAVPLPLQLVQLVLSNSTSNGTDAATCVPDAEGTGDIVVGFLLLAGIAISFMPQVLARRIARCAFTRRTAQRNGLN